MLHRGFDTTSDCTNHIEAIKKGNYSFVARYYSHSPWKNITHSEAKALSKAGIYIVAVWESAGDHGSFFTKQQGIQDGKDAVAFAEKIGQPKDTTIYFAVDADLPVFGGVQEYFEGVNSVVKDYHIGAYGSGRVCAGLSNLKLVTYTWLAQAPGWSGTKQYKDWNIKQLMPESKFDGLSVDFDIAATKGGGGFLVK